MNSNFSRNPVLLIHGIFRKSAIFHKMSAYLRDLGWSVYTLDLSPHWGNASIDELAQQMANYIDKNFEPEQRLDIVGLSMGGLVTRYYLQRLGGLNRVQRFIAISSPHSGTWTAYTLWGKGWRSNASGQCFSGRFKSKCCLVGKAEFLLRFGQIGISSSSLLLVRKYRRQKK